MSQQSLRATLMLTSLLTAASTVALGQGKTLHSLSARALLASADADSAERSLDLFLHPEQDGTLRVEVRNATGAAILRGTVKIKVAFANGLSQESRITIANLPQGASSDVNLELRNDDEDAVISAVEVVGSKLKGNAVQSLRVPVKTHVGPVDTAN